VRLLREGPARLLLHDALEVRDQRLERGGGQLRVRPGSRASLRGVQEHVKRATIDGEHHVPEERDEAPVAVPGEALVPGPVRQALHRLVVETQVEHGVHHPGHRGARPRADRHQQGTGRVPQAAARGGLEARQMSQDLAPEPRRMFLAGLGVGGPRLGRDGEAGRDRDAHPGHLGELAALAAEQVAERARSFRLAARERVDVLGAPGWTRGSPSRRLPTPGLRHHRPPDRYSGREKDTGPAAGPALISHGRVIARRCQQLIRYLRCGWARPFTGFRGAISSFARRATHSGPRRASR
jgi:hypothetical protein